MAAKRNSRFVLVCAALGVALGLALSAPVSAAPPTQAPAAPRKLSIVCSVQKDWCELLASRYAKEFSVQASVSQMSTNAALEQIRKTQGAGQFDVWFGGTGDPHLEAASEGLTVPHRSPHFSRLHDWSTRQAQLSSDRTIGVYAGMLGFIVNTEEAQRRNIRVPRCWFNLLRPEYTRNVLSTNPQSSGTAYTMISALVSMMGEEQAFQFMKQLNDSVGEFSSSGSTLAKRVAAGEYPIAIGFIHDGMKEKLDGAPIAVVSPCEGTGYETGSVSIIKGRNVKEAQRFVDWVLSPPTQALAAGVKQYQIPSNRDTPIPSGSMRFDELKIYQAYNPKKFSDPAEKSRLVSRWKSEIFDAWSAAR